MKLGDKVLIEGVVVALNHTPEGTQVEVETGTHFPTKCVWVSEADVLVIDLEAEKLAQPAGVASPKDTPPPPKPQPSPPPPLVKAAAKEVPKE